MSSFRGGELASVLTSLLDFWPSRIKDAERLREHLGIPPSRYPPSGHPCSFL